tara:strand:+ start:648 stop:902 length:255 start_codon:yes stop_codon:yes gene_type:complete
MESAVECAQILIQDKDNIEFCNEFSLVLLIRLSKAGGHDFQRLLKNLKDDFSHQPPNRKWTWRQTRFISLVLDSKIRSINGGSS